MRIGAREFASTLTARHGRSKFRVMETNRTLAALETLAEMATRSESRPDDIERYRQAMDDLQGDDRPYTAEELAEAEYWDTHGEL